MHSDDYSTFLSHVDPRSTLGAQVESLLYPYMNKVARGLATDPTDSDLEHIYTQFFARVIKLTGEVKTKSRSSTPICNMVDSWGKKTSDTLAVATYYYMYTLARGSLIVREIDHALFEGRSFAEKFGIKVPGGFEFGYDEIYSGPFVQKLMLRKPGIHRHFAHFSRRTIKVEGREEEEAMLHRFVDAGPGFRWLQIAGDGGQGKGRMAYDLMDYLGEKWESGFLDADALSEFQSYNGLSRIECWRCWRPTKPHLLIVDYIIGREHEIGFAMDQISDLEASLSVSVRVLIVERQRWDRGALQVSVDNLRDELPTAGSPSGRADWFVRLGENARNDLASDCLSFDGGMVEVGSA